MILGDKKSNGPQFSKLMVIFVGFISLICIIGVIIASLYLGLSESISISAIGAFGSIAATTLIWFLKKSQVENNTKIYMEAYKDIAMFKYEHGEDASAMLEMVEESIIGKMDNNVSNAIDEASTIEKEEIL